LPAARAVLVLVRVLVVVRVVAVGGRRAPLAPLDEEAVRDAVLDLVRVRDRVALVEADDALEVAEAGDDPVDGVGLDGGRTSTATST
jgi:hypothetical protein